MDRLKKFLGEKKVDKNFKKAGAGHKLSEDTAQLSTPVQGGSEASKDRIAASDAAAQAAYKRMNLGAKHESTTQRNIRLRALRELEEERRERERELAGTDSTGAQPTDVQQLEHSNAIKAVLYTCDLLGQHMILPKHELKAQVELFLRSEMHDDSVVASTLMLFSLNGAERRQLAADTLHKCIHNVILNPDQAKFRRIRLSNKSMQERVLCAKGGREFLEACGFEERIEPFTENGEPECLLVLSAEKALDVATLVQAVDVLQTGQPVPIQLHRNTAVYRIEPNQVIPNPKLSSDFFDLTGAEVKKEQTLKTARVEKMSTLRTREMRDRDELQRSYRYKYTLLRIKFPNNCFLQGTFGCDESLSAVHDFVQQHLAAQDLFTLKDPVMGTVLSNDTTTTISQLHLVPAALLHFEWHPAALARQSQQVPYLNANAMEGAENFVVA